MKTRFCVAIAFLLVMVNLAFVLTLLFGAAASTSAQGAGPLQPVVGYSIKNDVSPELSSIPPIPPEGTPEGKPTEREIPLQPLSKASDTPAALNQAPDPVVQDRPGTR